MSREVIEVCGYLRSKSINIPTNNEWLTSCVECFKEQGTYSLNELKELVYQQWLLADLADIGVQVIPSNCLSGEKVILEGKFAVQLNYFVNVAVSFHKQLQKIRRPDVLKNLEVDGETQPSTQSRQESTGARILKIELTDGVITIIGFEDQYISSLQEPFVPGKKAILVGPIECRKGILFLKQKNIILLGGEVDALLIPNASENVLARKLNQPENPDPYSQHLQSQDVSEGGHSAVVDDDECADDYEEAMAMLAEVIEKKAPDVNFTRPNNLNENNVSNSRREDSQRGNTFNPGNSASGSSTARHENVRAQPETVRHTSELQTRAGKQQSVFNIPNQTADLEFDDDFDLLADQTIVNAERNNLNERTRNIDEVASKFRAYELFDSSSVQKDLKEITELKQKLNESYNILPKRNLEYNGKAGSPVFREDGRIIVDYLSDKASPLTNLAPEQELSQNTPSSSEYELNDPGGSFFSLEPFPPRKRPAIVTAFARVVKVLKKPKLKGDKWSVSALVEAKGMEVEVTFDSDVIDKVFTVSASEIVSKKDELTSDPIMKQKMNETLKQSQLRFSKLACDMTFNFKDAISDPVIIDVNIDR